MIISALSHRINSKLITKKTDKSIEIKKLRETLKKNDYPEWFVRQTLRRTNKKWTDHIKEASFLVIKEKNYSSCASILGRFYRKKLQEFVKLLT